jgi:hypothetical protein
VNSRNGVDHVLVRVKAKEGADHNKIKNLVGSRLTDAFGVAAEVEIHPLLNLKSATGGWVSWKTARIKDLRVHAADDIEDRSAGDLARAVESAI